MPPPLTACTPLSLTDAEQSMLDGGAGEAMQFAMHLVVRAAEIMGAPRLLEAGFLHIDACHYYGRAHLDFARYFVDRGIKFEIPAWTNTLTVSLMPDESRAGADPLAIAESRELAGLFVKLGAKPVWTCAPYQLPDGPRIGDHIAVGESNAVAYYNSAVGARTNKYGDFLDVACGLTRRVPDAGLHTNAGRRGELVIDITSVSDDLRRTEFFCHVLGHHMGRIARKHIPVIVGLPADTHGDSLKAIAAAGAASGGIALFHAVGVTPEAPNLEAALQAAPPRATISVSPVELAATRDAMSTGGGGPVSMVALGTPHFSYTEFERLVHLLDGRKVASDVMLYVSTSRHVWALAGARGWDGILNKAGVTVLVDTCTYFNPAVRGCRGRVMTNSAKWAYYAPGMLGVEVAFGSLPDCVETAIHGEVRHCPKLWSERLWGTT